MILYLDTEFNGFGGELISMALVGLGRSWYEVASIPAIPHPFVREHVLPVLNKAPIGNESFKHSLHAFLLQYPQATIVADWPEDFSHFFQSICGPNGQQLKWEGAAELVLSGKLFPAIPHNALEDARALQEWHLPRVKQYI